MSPQRKTLAPFLALFIFCFAAQGVSSASIGSWDKEEIYSEQNTAAEILSLGTGLYSSRAPAIFACLGHYINDIKEAATRGHTLSADALKLVLEVSTNYKKCGEDLKCKVDVIVTGASQLLKVYNEARAWLTDIRAVIANISKCTREGGPTPAPPPTTPTPPPTTVPTTPPTTVPTTPPTTVPTTPPTTAPTTVPPTTKPPQPTQPSSTTKPL